MKNSDLDELLTRIKATDEEDVTYTIVLHGDSKDPQRENVECTSLMYGTGPNIARAITEAMDAIVKAHPKAAVMFAQKGLEYIEQAKAIVRNDLIGPDAIEGMREAITKKLAEEGRNVDITVLDASPEIQKMLDALKAAKGKRGNSALTGEHSDKVTSIFKNKTVH